MDALGELGDADVAERGPAAAGGSATPAGRPERAAQQPSSAAPRPPADSAPEPGTAPGSARTTPNAPARPAAQGPQRAASATLARPRLVALLDAVRDQRPVLLAAPAGHGKTTLLDQYAATWPGPVRRVRYAPGATAAPHEVFAAVREQAREPGVLLVLDDLHHLPHPAAALELLLAELPHAGLPSVHLLAATRPLPDLNLSRAELADVVVAGPDDLRLRWWEVDRLFAEVHGRPADPVLAWDATWLTGGWAAPLNEFLLCTRDLSHRQVRRTLTAPGVPFAAGYLDRQILGALDPDLCAFLTRCAIHTAPTAADCADAPTPAARAASAAMLRRAEQAGVMMRRGAGYAGETLLRHLLVHRLATTDPDAPAVFAAAAGRMRKAGDPVGAAWAAYLARDRAALRELMDGSPVAIAAAVPEHWHGLLRAFAGPAGPAGPEGPERPGDRPASRIASGDLGLLGDPAGAAEQPTSAVVLTSLAGAPTQIWDMPELPLDAEGVLVRGITLFGTGDYRTAIEVLTDFAREHDGPPAAFAGLLVLLGAMLSGHGCDVREAEAAAQRVAGHGPAWLGRVARAGLTLTGAPEHRGEAAAVRAACDRLGDAWGSAVAGHLEACAGVLRGEPDPAVLAASARRLRDAGMIAAVPWSLAFEAIARAQLAEPDALDLAVQAEAEAAHLQLPGAAVLARCARLLAAPASADADRAALAADAERLGIRIDTFLRVRREADDAPATPVDIRCFGGFTVRLAGKPVDLLRLAPQSRVLFRLLALHAGRPVHREVLAAALWPDAPADAAFHRLQTAVYKLRRFLEPARGRRGASEFVPFEDGAYRLRLPEGSYLDIAAAEDALARARQAAMRGDAAGETATLRELLAVADAMLLPETGPEEWILDARERWSEAAADARARLAALVR
ncbi:winged helix-turn-helix domain-containing protein [Yinghuangia soli]|uniref:Winged helix-turn-helix domain-containing protein n=1 Tax=Yinghuangia soli TaxID=2908204 RepID=A0AA41Q640_9ACTN|nr:winged helix-turn-helix domain-containing protein [Yinghuangia soli]MCF2531665.1 winged helix-turn-helix domain-containing protein [Yinghuangia soli]